MAPLFRKILCPVDFDENSTAALETAARIARENGATIHVLHVVPMMVAPVGVPNYVDLYQGQEQAARKKLTELAHRYLKDLKTELLVHIGIPTSAILAVERKVGADLIVMATHGRRGVRRFLIGSVAEMVLREAQCPVLSIHNVKPAERDEVRYWMTQHPMVATPEEPLSSVRQKLFEGGFRSMPVAKDGKLVGIVTDRDVRSFTGVQESTAVRNAMSEVLVTVAPETPVREAARLLRERKIGGLPVIENNKLVGMITGTDLLAALTAEP